MNDATRLDSNAFGSVPVDPACVEYAPDPSTVATVTPTTAARNTHRIVMSIDSTGNGGATQGQ